jgi:hypothetical protein
MVESIRAPSICPRTAMVPCRLDQNAQHFSSPLGQTPLIWGLTENSPSNFPAADTADHLRHWPVPSI